MELTHRFTVPAPLEEAWRSFNDLEALAPCFPGAGLSSVQGDHFSGTVKVKFGPATLVFNGDGSFRQRDHRGHRIMITATGADRRGHGTAELRVTTTLRPEGEASTAVEIRSDLALTGRPAQFGRGVVSDVSDRLVDQFAECLGARLAAGEVDAREVPASTGPDARSDGPIPDNEPVATGLGPIGGGAQSGGASGVTGASSGSATPPVTSDEPEALRWQPADPSRIGAAAGDRPGALRRYAPPLLAGATFVGLVITIIRRIRSR